MTNKNQGLIKKIRQTLNEEVAAGALSSDSAIDNPSHNLHALDDDAILKLNAYLGNIANMTYFDLESVVTRVFNKLTLVGLTFDYRLAREETRRVSKLATESGMSEVASIPLSAYGGRVGYLTVDGVIGSDNGISHRLGYDLELVIEVIYVPTTAQFGLQIRIEKVDIPEDVLEAASGAAYKAFLKKALKKFGFDSLDDMNDAETKKFFKYVDDKWDSIDEGHKSPSLEV